jgi:site-specific DNA-cytosine methylase
MNQLMQLTKEYTVMCFYGGEGGGGKGAQDAPPAVIDNIMARCEVLGSIDVDAQACADFEMWTGVKATCFDMFDRDQYRDFHGKEPPASWKEVTLEQIRAAAQNRRPNIVMVTAPCKGYSGLLGKEKAKSRKYEALNRLAERGVFLALEAWADNPPDFIIFENVKGIQTRGAKFLRKIEQLLAAYGYRWHPDHYDCGEWGGLAQHRKRFLGFARREATVPAFLFHPVTQRVRAIEEVIGEMPLPIDPDHPPADMDAAGGPMHMSPRLQWKTWVRLALIPPGGDWRDLQKIRPGEYSIVPVPGRPKHFDIVRTDSLMGAGAPVTGDLQQAHMARGDAHPMKYEISDGSEPSPTVTASRFGSGAPAVADPRVITGNVAMEGFSEDRTHHVKYLVQEMDGTANTVTGQKDVQTGAPIVADHRLNDSGSRHGNQFRVQAMDEAAGTVTAHNAGSGASLIADPRPLGHTPMGGGKGAYLVQDVTEASGTITGDPSHRKSGAASVIADPRLDSHQRDGAMRVGDAGDPSGPVIGSAAVTSSNGIGAVADPRPPHHGQNYKGSPGLMGVLDGSEPANAITGSASVSGSNCPAAVADPRYEREPRSGVYAVQDTADPSKTVTGGKDPNGNMLCVADPGQGARFNNVQAVTDMTDSAQAVTAASGNSNAAAVVADPRETGLYGNMLRVNDVGEPGNTVTGAAGPNQGANLVADPRMTCTPRGNTKGPLGVQDMSEPAATVTGQGDVHTGAVTVADPRLSGDDQAQVVDAGRIPGDEERGVWYIRSPHTDKKGRRCWHRPMTTLELLAIQGFPTRRPDGSAVVLAGKSDRSWRERIGNAWPPPAAAAIIGNMLMSLLASATVGFLWDYQQTGVLVLPPGAVPEKEHEVA